MTWVEGFAGLQLVAEQDVGTKLRAHNRAEDRKLDRGVDALRREQQEMI